MAMKYVLRAYWRARRESVQQCANRLERCLGELATYDSALTGWREIGRSRKQSQQGGVEAHNKTCLIDLLERGRNRRETDRIPIDELGFRVSLWNGLKPPTEASLNVKCGLYWLSDTPTTSLSNCVLLDFPEALGQLSSPQRMTKVLAMIAEAWEPDWAGVMSRKAMDERGFDAGTPFVDWMVYLPRKFEILPEPSSVLGLPSGGSIIVVQPDTPSADVPRNLSLIHRIERVIEMTG